MLKAKLKCQVNRIADFGTMAMSTTKEKESSMKSMTIEQAIKYLKDFQKNLCPGKQLYIKVTDGAIGVFSDSACTTDSIEATL